MSVHAVFITLVVWYNIKPGIGILSEVYFLFRTVLVTFICGFYLYACERVLFYFYSDCIRSLSSIYLGKDYDLVYTKNSKK